MSYPSSERNESPQSPTFSSEQLLKNYTIDIDLNTDLQTFSFTNGEQLLPFKEYLEPKFQKLWASALSREPDDKLVIEDSAIFPYAPTDHIIITQNPLIEFPVFFSYRDLVAPNGDAGIYLHICLIDQKYQGKGIVKKFLSQVIEKTNSKFVALTTQNEHMVQALRPFCPIGSLFPIDGMPPDEIKIIADNLMTNKANFDQNTFVIKGVYSNGSPLYGDRVERHTKHTDVRSYFEKNVDFQKGDAVLVVGKISNKLVNAIS